MSIRKPTKVHLCVDEDGIPYGGANLCDADERFIGYFEREGDAREIARALNTHARLVELARAYEKWEADLIMSNEAWQTIGGLPKLTPPLWSRLLEIQTMRNSTLAEATGGKDES